MPYHDDRDPSIQVAVINSGSIWLEYNDPFICSFMLFCTEFSACLLEKEFKAVSILHFSRGWKQCRVQRLLLMFDLSSLPVLKHIFMIYS